jgi:protein phosphatase
MRDFGAGTHPGHQRKNNEDSFATDPESGLWLVADGVGGHAGGEIASAIVGATLRRRVAAGESLRQAIVSAHEAILAEIGDSEAGNDMGSTVVALQLQGQEYEIGWVGDSRAYLWDGTLRQLTRDHNPVSELLVRGLISSAEATQHPERHVLTQSLGISSHMQVQPGQLQGELQDHQQILLCSDGLSDELSDAVIASHLAAHDDPQAQVDALLAAALAAGGRDNITVVVLGPEKSEALRPLPTERDSALITTARLARVEVEEAAPAMSGRSFTPRSWVIMAVVLSVLVAAVMVLLK